MTQVYDLILQKISENSQLDSSLSFLAALPPDKIKHKIFCNYRLFRGQELGLRLNRFGFTVISRFFKYYTLDRKDKEFLKSKDILNLDKICKFPYYYDERVFVFFEEDLAALMVLSDINLELLKDFS